MVVLLDHLQFVLALLPMTPVSAHSKHFLSDKVEHFTESVIREMTRQAMQYGRRQSGRRDFPISPRPLKSSALRKKPSPPT